MSDYYDWNKTLSYDADVTMVIGARGIGKTYGLRLQFIRDWIKDGSRFVELTRHKNELSDFAATYFNRIIENEEFPDYLFKTTPRHAYIALKPKDKKDKKGNEIKPKWQLIGYFGALTEAQAMKKRTYSKVKRMLLDEAVIDKRLDRFHNYLPNEFGILANILDSVSRERSETKNSDRCRVYLLGNACDLLNIYFGAYNINAEPKEGYSWHKGKTMLLHYVKDAKYAKAKTKDTVAGRMLADTADELVASANEFLRANDDFVFKKPKNAKFNFGIVYLNNSFGVWADFNNGYYYITDKIPKNAKPIYALTANDNKVNYIMAKRAEGVLRGFTDLYYLGIIRYETPYIKERFIEVLNLFGVR